MKTYSKIFCRIIKIDFVNHGQVGFDVVIYFPQNTLQLCTFMHTLHYVSVFFYFLQELTKIYMLEGTMRLGPVVPSKSQKIPLSTLPKKALGIQQPLFIYSRKKVKLIFLIMYLM